MIDVRHYTERRGSKNFGGGMQFWIKLNVTYITTTKTHRYRRGRSWVRFLGGSNQTPLPTVCPHSDVSTLDRRNGTKTGLTTRCALLRNTASIIKISYSFLDWMRSRYTWKRWWISTLKMYSGQGCIQKLFQGQEIQFWPFLKCTSLRQR